MPQLIQRLQRDGIQWSNYVVLYIDLLGQREMLTPWMGLENPISQQCSDALSFHTSRVAAWRQLFRDFRRDLPKGKSDRPCATDWAEQSLVLAVQEYQRCFAVDLKSQQFGDTAILYAQPRTSEGLLNLRALELLVAAASFASIMSMALGIPLRGALTFGCATEFQNGDLYGPALAQAHVLESRVAQWPRVVVGPNVVELLYEVGTWRSRSFAELYQHHVARRCMGRFCMLEDSHAMVEMVGPRVTNLYNRPAGFAHYGREAYRNAQAELERISQSAHHDNYEKSRLVGRYQKLLDYLCSRGLG